MDFWSPRAANRRPRPRHRQRPPPRRRRPHRAASAEATAQATAAASASIAASQATGDVARNKTLIFGAVGDTLRTENNWNPLAAQATHPDSNSYGLYEELFYTNLNTGELIPWQAESYKISDDYTGVTLKLRDGVTWCDGVQFTADDVKYCLDLLKTGDPAYFDSANYKEYIKSGRHRRQADRPDHAHQARPEVVQGRVHARA